MTQPSREITFFLKADHIYVFFPLFQQGVQITARVGCSIQSLLCDQYDLSANYLAERINTIFLDGQPVDDMATAIVRNGATLALSAAMPGLVGATFRKAGYLAPFRGSITYRDEDHGGRTRREGTIILKLFNLLLKEMGGPILERGIRMEGQQLINFFRTNKNNHDTIFKRIAKNGRDLSPAEIADPQWISPADVYFLKTAWDH